MHFQKPMLGVPLDWSNHLNKGLVMHLAMNEGHGDVVRDLSMNGNHGTLGGFAFPSTVVSGWNPGQTGVGLNFDGADDYIGCRYHESFVINTGSILSLFLAHPNQLAFGGRTLEIGEADNRIGLHIWDDHKLHLFGKVAAATVINLVSVDSLDDSMWHHGCGTWDSTGAKLYVDGNVVDTVIGDKTLTLPSPALCHIGEGLDGMWRGFDGGIDQPRIQSRVLSAKEVMDYYINPWQVYLDE